MRGARQRLLAEIPPANRHRDGEQYQGEEELSQGDVCSREKERLAEVRFGRLIFERSYLLTAAVSRTPIAGTVFPTTAAIWRTCDISTSNWSGNSDCAPSDSASSGLW